MIPNEPAIRTWLWMQAVDYVCTDIWRSCKCHVEPDEDKRRFMNFTDLLEKSYRYAIDHWDDIIHRTSSIAGSCSGHNHYCLGYNINRNSRGVIADFRSISVTVTYPEVKKFIERLLEPPQMAERQMTMLEIMSAYKEDPNAQ